MSYKFTDFLNKKSEKQLSKMTNQEIYYKLLEYVKERADEKTKNESKKKIYYISAEFLIGKLLSNNLINLGIYKEVRDELKAAGKNLSHVEEVETEPSLLLVSLIQCQLWELMEKELDLTIIADYSSKFLEIMSKRLKQTTGLKMKAG